MKRFLTVLLLTACAHVGGSRFVQGPQGKLHVDDGGSGRAVPVIFLHSGAGNLTQWRAQLDHVRKTRRAVAFDLRGMGESDPAANGDYSVTAMADDVVAVADGLKIPRFVLVGHSLGGGVALAFSEKYPNRLAGVVYADAAGNVKVAKDDADKFLAALRANKHDFMRQWWAPILKNSSDEVKNAVLASADRTPVEVIISGLESMLALDAGRALSVYKGPRLAIAAAAIESPASLHVQFPDVPGKKIEGTGHWLHMDKPEQFNRLLDEFLATIR